MLIINIISEEYKNDYLNCRGEDEAEMPSKTDLWRTNFPIEIEEASCYY